MAVTVDTLKSSQVNYGGVPARAFDITPHDSNYLADSNDVQFHTCGIMATVGGTCTAIFVGDSSAVQFTMVAGTYYPFLIKKVNATGTAATGLKGFRN